MLEFYTASGEVTIVRAWDRDLRLAEEFGKRAARFESDQPGIFAGSQRVRHDFRKAVLDRYDPATWPWRDDLASDVLDKRRILNDLYYSARVSDALIVEPDVFSPPGEIEASSFEVEYGPAALEMLSV